MNCPKCGYAQDADNRECPSCGIVFAKWRQRQAAAPAVPSPRTNSAADEAPAPGMFEALFLHLPDAVNPIAWGLRLALLAILLVWGLRFIFAPIDSDAVMQSVWHLVNLPFHEAGHILFRPFGRLMTALGGSLMQVLMPTVCLVVFLIRTRDPFAGSFALWWTGQNFVDLAPYINDARALRLPLLGGNVGSRAPYGFHDWEFILRETGLIRLDHSLARLAHGIGALLIVTAVVWGGWILARQYAIMRAPRG